MNGSMSRFLSTRGRYTHISAPIDIRKRVIFAERQCGGITLPAVTVDEPVVRKPGITFDIGVRKAKQAARILGLSPQYAKVATYVAAAR